MSVIVTNSPAAGCIELKVSYNKKPIAAKVFKISEEWEEYKMVLTPDQWLFPSWSDAEIEVNCFYQVLTFKDFKADADVITFKAKLGAEKVEGIKLSRDIPRPISALL